MKKQRRNGKSGRHGNSLDHPRTLNSGWIGVSLILAEREQRFDSDTERRFAILLEDEGENLKWFKPGKGQLNIYYSADHSYEPDFIVETSTMKYLCEPKRESEMNDPVVQSKARAAATWCNHATAHAAEHEGKPWAYLLIPHTKIVSSASLQGLARAYSVTV